MHDDVVQVVTGRDVCIAAHAHVRQRQIALSVQHEGFGVMSLSGRAMHGTWGHG